MGYSEMHILFHWKIATGSFFSMHKVPHHLGVKTKDLSTHIEVPFKDKTNEV